MRAARASCTHRDASRCIAKPTKQGLAALRASSMHRTRDQRSAPSTPTCVRVRRKPSQRTRHQPAYDARALRAFTQTRRDARCIERVPYTQVRTRNQRVRNARTSQRKSTHAQVTHARLNALPARASAPRHPAGGFGEERPRSPHRPASPPNVFPRGTAPRTATTSTSTAGL